MPTAADDPTANPSTGTPDPPTRPSDPGPPTAEGSAPAADSTAPAADSTAPAADSTAPPATHGAAAGPVGAPGADPPSAPGPEPAPATPVPAESGSPELPDGGSLGPADHEPTVSLRRPSAEEPTVAMRRPPAGSDETRPRTPPDRTEPPTRSSSPFPELYPSAPIAADGPTVRLDRAFADAHAAAVTDTSSACETSSVPDAEDADATTAAQPAAVSDPEPVPVADPGEAPPDPGRGAGAVRPRPAAARLSAGTVLIGVLLALFGFVLVVQLRSTNADEGLSAARQEDLVRILSDLQAREQRLNDDISALESTRQQLASGVEGRQAARAEAERREKELGLLAGTLPARGPGLHITVTGAQGKPVKAAAMLNAVQELRGAGSEVIQLSGSAGTAVRVIASTAFVDDNGGLSVGGTRLAGPYQLTAIGSPKILVPALNIAGGAVAGFERDGGTVNIVELDTVEVTATREPADLKYARPVS